MNKVARRSSHASLPIGPVAWTSEAVFITAVIAEAKREILLAPWPDDWRAAFQDDDVLVDNAQRESAQRAAIAARAARAVRSFLALDAALFAEYLDGAAFLLESLAPTDDQPSDRRSELAITITNLAHHYKMKIGNREFALLSIVNGWAREEHPAWKAKTVKKAIADEAKAMSLARSRHAPTMAGDLARRAIAKARELGAHEMIRAQHAAHK